MKITENKNPREYFTAETERYIILYNNTEDAEQRSKIFSEHIYYPFYKLSEFIINSFKMWYTDLDTIEDLKCYLVKMLWEEKISGFNPENGAKAYSYFGTIVKRWLIANNKKNFKKLKQSGDLEEHTGYYEIDEKLNVDSQISLSNFIDMFVERIYLDMNNLFQKEQDKKIADAVLTVFKVRQSLDNFKKKALYIYIREMTDCDTSSLTRVVSKLKGEFYQQYSEYENHTLISRSL